MVEAGELNHPQDSGPSTEKVLDSPANSRTFAAFPQDEASPKRAHKGPDNPEETGPGPVTLKGPQNQ
jgi:hypothetical protein